MGLAETLVYGSVWAALLCYPAAAIGRAAASPSIERGARFVWSVGCIVFWIHVVSAFGAFYDWRHAVALAETARQTRDATGFDSGAGLYLNYAFVLLWTVDAAWWWWRPASYRARSRTHFLVVHAFFLFMIVNGAVIFVPGPRRWIGVLVTLAGAAAVAHAVTRDRN